MLNFSCEYKELKLNKKLELNTHHFKVTAPKLSGLCKELIAKMESEVKRVDLSTLSLKDLVVACLEIEKARSVLVTLRTANTTDWRRSSSLKDEMGNAVNALYCNYKSKKSNLSMAEELLLKEASDGVLFHSLCRWDVAEYYNPAKQCSKKINKYQEELTSFPYKDYKVDKNIILAKINSVFEEVNKAIKAFEFLVTEAGDDLINWSQHKITRRLNSNGFNENFYGLHGYIEEYNKHLKKKGVKPENKKATKGPNKFERTLVKFSEGAELTQDEVLTLFKNTNVKEAGRYSHLMEYQTIVDLFNATTQNVKERIFGRYGGSLESTGRKLITQLCEVEPKTGTSFVTILCLAKKHNAIQSLSWEFITTHIDKLNTDDFISFAGRNNPESISEEFYDKYIKVLPISKILDTTSLFTKEYVKRLDEQDKISILTRLCGNFIETKTNSASFILSQNPWDSIQSVEFDTGDFVELYNDVAWNEIKETVKDNKRILEQSIDLILKNKDKEVAKEALIKFPLGFSFGDDVALKLFNLFTEKERVKIILEVSENKGVSNSGYERMLGNILETEESIQSLFKYILDNMSKDMFSPVLNVIKKRKYDLSSYRNIILSQDRISSYPLTENSLNILSKECKLKLINERTDISNNSTSTYMYRTTGTVNGIDEFYKGLTKEEITKAAECALPQYGGRKYLAHLMTTDEMIESCEMSSEFLRYNIALLPYSYLKKYESKKAFKEIVGDQRNSTNRSFASRLTSKFEEQLKQKVSPPNTVKMMFAS